MASTLFQLVDQVVFEPIQSEPPQVAKAFLPASFLIRSHPFDYFTLFFTHALLEIITKHKNQYTAIQRLEGKEGQREWYNLVVEELYIFLGYIIYIGIYKEPDISIY
jgi:hypothetical protein